MPTHGENARALPRQNEQVPRDPSLYSADADVAGDELRSFSSIDDDSMRAETGSGSVSFVTMDVLDGENHYPAPGYNVLPRREHPRREGSRQQHSGRQHQQGGHPRQEHPRQEHPRQEHPRQEPSQREPPRQGHPRQGYAQQGHARRGHTIQGNTRRGPSSTGNMVTNRSGTRTCNGKPSATKTMRVSWITRLHVVWKRIGPWRWDMLALVFASTLLAAEAAILASYDNLSLTHWQARMSINTIISTISTVVMFTLMNPLGNAVGQCKWLLFRRKHQPLLYFAHLDGASRGPYGSLKLLTRFKWYGVLPAFGALLMVATLAVNPFMQQLIVIEFRDRAVGEAFLPVVLDHTMAYPNYGSSFVHDLTLNSAVYVGFVRPLDMTLNVTSVCPSGNCTWPAFHTLAICSSCTDITEQISSTPTSTEFPKNYTLPNGIFMNDTGGQWGNVLMNVTTMTGLYGQNNWTIDTLVPENMTLAYADRGSLITDFFVLRMAQDGRFGPDTAVARECILQYCVQQIRAEQRNSELVETVLATWTNDSVPARRFSSKNEKLDTDTQPPLLLKPPGQDRTFYVAATAQANTNGYMDYIINGTARPQMHSIYPVYTSDYTEVIYKSFDHGKDGLSKVMANVASAMTAALRSASNSTTTGTAYIIEPYIHIAWPWLALPLSLYALVAMFVALVILAGRSKDRPADAWKNSALAAVFHGLHPDLRQEFGALDRQVQIDAVAKDLVVRLCDGAGGLRFERRLGRELDDWR